MPFVVTMVFADSIPVRAPYNVTYSKSGLFLFDVLQNLTDSDKVCF